MEGEHWHEHEVGNSRNVTNHKKNEVGNSSIATNHKKNLKNKTKSLITSKCYPDFSCNKKYSLLKIKINVFDGVIAHFIEERIMWIAADTKYYKSANYS